MTLLREVLFVLIQMNTLSPSVPNFNAHLKLTSLIPSQIKAIFYLDFSKYPTNWGKGSSDNLGITMNVIFA